MADKYTPKLGDAVTDNITGVPGIVVGILTRMHGQKTYEIQPVQPKDGVPADPIWLAAGRLEQVFMAD